MVMVKDLMKVHLIRKVSYFCGIQQFKGIDKFLWTSISKIPILVTISIHINLKFIIISYLVMHPM